MKYDYRFLLKPLLGKLELCGDLVFVEKSYQGYLIGLVDVLGHGKESRKLAIQVSDFLESNAHLPMDELIRQLHGFLIGSRGVVAGFCLINTKNENASYIGVGNVYSLLVNKDVTVLQSSDGILGYGRLKLEAETFEISPGDMIIMLSDGMNHHISSSWLKEVRHKDASWIAKRLIMNHSKNIDDASCVVFKCLGGDHNEL